MVETHASGTATRPSEVGHVDAESWSVREYYERPEVIAAYSGDGALNPVEEALVEKYVHGHARILDVGTGGGRVALELARRGYPVTGIDVSRGMVDAARSSASRLGLEIAFEVCDAMSLPYPDGAFDASVFFCNGIGHFDRAGMRACIRELGRVTRTGGIVLIALRTPYALNTLLPGLLRRSLFRRGAARDELVDHGVYVNRPSLRTMRGLLALAGLEHVETLPLRPAARRRPAHIGESYIGGQFFLIARVP